MSWKVIGARFQISQRVCRIPVSVKLRWIIPENIFSRKLGGWCFLILWNWWVKVLSLYHATWARWNHVLYDKIKGCISSDRVDLSIPHIFSISIYPQARSTNLLGKGGTRRISWAINPCHQSYIITCSAASQTLKILSKMNLPTRTKRNSLRMLIPEVNGFR